MPNPLELRRRIRSVDNTRQITRAMQLVAASRMRRAQDAVEAARPYADRMTDTVRRLVLSCAADQLPDLLQIRPIVRIAFLVMTTDRGLAGPLNTNIVRTVVAEMDEAGDTSDTSLLIVGRKGQVALAGARNIHRDTNGRDAVFTGLGDQPEIGYIRPAMNLLVDGYLGGQFDEVRVIYPEFVNTLTQRPKTVRVLPILLPHEREQVREVDVIFEPSSKAVLQAIGPRFVEMTLYRALLELVASEQSARMVAMRAATENATELIEGLQRAYNKLRQARITSEIIDIASGAKALADV